MIRIILLMMLSIDCLAQSTIALTNHVKYKNGDSYIDPSIQYAGTAFLLESDKGVFAITAKHVLWIAKNKKSKSVEVNKDIGRWVMRSRDNKDSVVVDKLINEDPNEILEGPTSTILERDWLVFSVKRSTQGIQKLKPRTAAIIEGERVFVIGNPYSENRTRIFESRVVRKLGMDILIESPPGGVMPGYSGSPAFDKNGQVMGVFSSMSTDPVTGKNVCVLVSTEYFQKVVNNEPRKNAPKKDYGELIFDTANKSGAKAAIDQYKTLAADPKNYYIYNLRSPSRNGLAEAGDKLLKLKKYKDAIEILQFNVSVNNAYFDNYNKLAYALLASGNREDAVKYYNLSIEKLNDKEENPAFKELEKLGAPKN